MTKTGRPHIEINKKEFEKLCGLQCTEAEICGWFGCCEDTLNKWCKNNYKNESGKSMTFSEVFEQKRANGKISLRRAQMQTALAGNATLLVWLGKNWLGQSDKPETAIDTEDSAAFFTEAGLK